MKYLAPGAVFLWLLVALAAVLLPESEVELQLALAGPGSDALFGRDALGKPVSMLLLGGAQTAALIGLSSVLLAGSFGVALGIVAGLKGGALDTLLMRVVDILLAFPGILLAIAITAALGPSIGNIVLALSILGWTGFARLARGQTLQIKEETYISALHCQGARTWRIGFFHVLPNLAGPVMVQATFAVAGAIIAESSLSFLGLGDPTTASWGAMLAEGVRFLNDAPHLSIFPGIAISIVVLALNIAGDDLSDWLDPQRE